MKKIILNALALSLILAVSACGGPAKSTRSTPPPPPPDDPGAGGVPKVQPKRRVSKRAKIGFKDAVKAYNAAMKAGGVNSSNCADLAEKFGDVYVDHPKVPEAAFNQAAILEECGKIAEAERIYQAIIKKHPKFGPALNNLGQMYFKKNAKSSALQYFESAARAKNTEGYANLAVMKRNQALAGDRAALAATISNVHRSLAVDSNNIDAYGTLALVLYDHAKNDSQLELARLISAQAIKVNKDYSPIYNILGLILLRQGKVTPALAEFRKAVKLNPNYIEAQMNIGAITLSFRDYASAEAAFTKVLSLNPTRKIKVDALVGLGVAYRGQRKFDQAMSKYQDAQRQAPTRASIAYNMGILVQDYLFDAGKPLEAVKQLKKAAKHLRKYQSGGKNKKKLADVKRRLKNIDELIPMLIEQDKMMKEMQKMQNQPQPAPEPAPAPAPAAAPAAKPAAGGAKK